MLLHREEIGRGLGPQFSIYLNRLYHNSGQASRSPRDSQFLKAVSDYYSYFSYMDPVFTQMMKHF